MARFDTRRWRWRMRGAWLWPTFVLLTVAEAILLVRLPVWGDGPEGGAIAAGLLAACLNLIVVAVIAPLVGLLVRLRRRDLPRAIAADYAGTTLLVVLFAGLLVGGLTHRDERQEDAHGRAVTAAAVDDWIRREQPDFARNLAGLDTIRIDEDLYRGCVPGTGTQRPLCLFVRTGGRDGVGVEPDGDRVPNDAYRSRGGF